MLILEPELCERLERSGLLQEYEVLDLDGEGEIDVASLTPRARARLAGLGFFEEIGGFLADNAGDIFDFALEGAGTGFAIYQGLEKTDNAKDTLKLAQQQLQLQLLALQGGTKPPAQTAPAPAPAPAAAPQTVAQTVAPAPAADHTGLYVAGGLGLGALALLGLIFSGNGKKR